MAKVPSVLMGIPTFGLYPDPNRWLATFLGALNEFSLRGWKVGTYFVYRKPVVDADNEIAHAAISTGADYVFRMDDDIWGFQPGYVNKLIDADKEFISGVMNVAGFPYARCAFVRKHPEKNLNDIFKNREFELVEVTGQGAVPCDMTATPFTLIKTTVYEKILRPYYDKIEGVAPDSTFCQKLLDAGIQPYAHMDVLLNHREVTPWNRHYLYNAEARAMLASKSLSEDSELFNILAKDFGPDGRKDPQMLKGVVFE
jgi:hypothetical protein